MKLNIADSTSLIIYSKKFWNETGIEVQTGEEYIFEAEGSWCDLLTPCDADGYTKFYMKLFDKMKRSEENKWFALIGSINQTSDFLIGKNKQKKIEENGMLFCYANDVKGFYWNNSGSVSLKITRIK